MKKTLLLCAGFFSIALGIMGIFLPFMPCLPFFILASICFSKSSLKFHNMLMNNRFVGPHIRSYHENNGITLKAKAVFIIGQWVFLALTMAFLIHHRPARILLVIIAIGTTIFILSLGTAKGKNIGPAS